MRIENPEGLDSSSSFCSYPLVTEFSSITSAGMWQVGFMGRHCSTLKQDVCTLTSVSHLILLTFLGHSLHSGPHVSLLCGALPNSHQAGRMCCHKTPGDLWGRFRKTPEGVGSAGLGLVPSCPRDHIRGKAPILQAQNRHSEEGHFCAFSHPGFSAPDSSEYIVLSAGSHQRKGVLPPPPLHLMGCCVILDFLRNQ